MATKSNITVEKVISYIKDKWQVFGVSALVIFILQILSTKLLVSVLVGFGVTALLPSDTIKKVTKKVKGGSE
tara:strand:+ start:91 stop:306 length:216 start_codon:yes stop_codon:yes gene_type:complete